MTAREGVANGDLYAIVAGSPLPRISVEEAGNKAWNLMKMNAAGLPVPSAFVLPTTWRGRLESAESAADLKRALVCGIGLIETTTGLKFGSPRRPLLVSVRSGAAVSMPGMMETVLDVGLNEETVRGLIGLTGNPHLAWDSYRRFVENYATVVSNLPRDPFDQLLQQAVSNAGVKSERELDFRELRAVARDMLSRFEELCGAPFPEDPHEQLRSAVLAVFRSWDAPKAVAYRRANHIGDSGGTAATIQTMVFGNSGGASGSGVAFTRDPATGEPALYLDFQFHAQGEDVVGGQQALDDSARLQRTLPEIWSQIQAIGRKLESLFHDAQDFEFTLERGVLNLLQTRSARRTAWAAVRIAVDLVEEGSIQPREALARLASIDLGSVARTRLSIGGERPLAHGIPASIGCAAVEQLAKDGTPAILVRRETVTQDIQGIARAAGILTQLGGRTSHAAVVARELNKVCLVGCANVRVDLQHRRCDIGGRIINEGEFISLDCNDGAVYAGHLAIESERPERELARIAAWQLEK